MKRNLTKFLLVFSIAILFAIGSAWAGGRSHYSHQPNASFYKGYNHHGNGWGYRHHGPPYRYHHHGYGPRYYNYRYYGPPAYYQYNNFYYPGAWGGYDGAYYFSGGFSEPGFGFAFGTRGNW